MSIRFTKMQALGNDFVVLDCVRQSIDINKTLIQRLADRHLGVGCDQVLILGPTQNNQADFSYRIFNPDGNEVYQCGNGARCIGLFIQQEKLSDKSIYVLETKHNTMRVECQANQYVQVDIAIPQFDPAALPFRTNQNTAPYHLQLMGYAIDFDVVSVGNPHCIVQRNDYSLADIVSIGRQVNEHPAFPEGVNVGFVKKCSRNEIELCVYERGAGVTEACGSGACAAVAVGCYRDDLDSMVTVRQAGGQVQVFWKTADAAIQLRGIATRVFEGIWLD